MNETQFGGRDAAVEGMPAAALKRRIDPDEAITVPKTRAKGA